MEIKYRIKAYKQAIEDYSNPKDNLFFAFNGRKHNLKIGMIEYGFCAYFKKCDIEDFELELTELVALKPNKDIDEFDYWWNRKSPKIRLKKLKIALSKALPL